MFSLDEPYYPVRLVSSNGKESEGCVQLFHNNTWGSFCGESSLSTTDANVLCRTLGFPSASTVTACSGYPSASYYSQPVWLSNIECDGEEKSIMECSHSPYGLHSCEGHTQDVAVKCKGRGVIR